MIALTLGIMLMMIGACQQKTRYITIYRKAKINCIAPLFPEFEDEEKYENCFDKILARRRNSILAYHVLKEWRVYEQCVVEQSN